MKQVRAIGLGFYKGHMVKEGAVFSVPSTFTAKWVIDADAPVEPKKPEVEKKEPETLSELGRRGRRGPSGLQATENSKE